MTGETHEWDGVGWRRLRPRVAPLARTDMSLAYDPVRRVVVLFGGERPNRLAKNDLWEWDGFDWRERVTPLAPSPRKGAGFAYDPHRKEMLLFGGFQQLGVANVWVYFEDTWSWNGERWEQLAPTTVPEARSFSLMTTDPARGEILLYGGGARKDHPDPDIGIRDYAFDDTWNWDGSNWVLRDAGGSCFFPCSASFGGVQRGGLFDRGSQAVVRIPDSNPGPTRAWNGTQWTIIPNVQSVRRTMIDPVTGNAVIDSQATGLHRLVSGVWEPLQPPQVPGARSDYGLASWTRRGRVVMSGGTNASLRLSDTWEWDGHQWKRMADAPVAGASVLVEDPIDGVMAILPGDRTFRYSQNGWQELQASPPDYDGVTMAYDRRRNVVVLYRVGVGFVDGETWEWDGMTWLQRSASPPHRRGVSLAYDEQRGRVVMVGGAPNIFVYTDEVWEWDGASWIPLAPFAISRTGAAMAHDRDRGRLILFGVTVGAFSGEFGVSVGTLGDTWERDENGMWRVLDIELAPPHRFA
ncbi:MAG: hypothetical protein ACKV2T_22185, partial [Kofleriaceae bacterium]